MMRIAVGFKAHSGWAALVALGCSADGVTVVDRRRIELVEPDEAGWAKQPYHAAERLPSKEARRLVERSIKAANRAAAKEMRDLVKRSSKAGHEIIGCAVLVGAPMPAWTIEQILAVHIRMHKAEGVLFPAALSQTATACNLKLVAILEKELSARAGKLPGLNDATNKLAALGKSIGPPWGKDQKSAALAAMIVLAEYQG